MERRKFTTTMNPEVIRLLKVIAAENETDAGRMIEKLVLDYVKKKEEQKPQN